MDIEKFIENDINDIWEQFENLGFANIPPLAIKEVFCENSILFIGLNPSLDRAVKVSHFGRKKVSIANHVLKIDSIEV